MKKISELNYEAKPKLSLKLRKLNKVPHLISSPSRPVSSESNSSPKPPHTGQSKPPPHSSETASPPGQKKLLKHRPNRVISSHGKKTVQENSPHSCLNPEPKTNVENICDKADSLTPLPTACTVTPGSKLSPNKAQVLKRSNKSLMKRSISRREGERDINYDMSGNTSNERKIVNGRKPSSLKLKRKRDRAVLRGRPSSLAKSSRREKECVDLEADLSRETAEGSCESPRPAAQRKNKKRRISDSDSSEEMPVQKMKELSSDKTGTDGSCDTRQESSTSLEQVCTGEECLGNSPCEHDKLECVSHSNVDHLLPTREKKVEEKYLTVNGSSSVVEAREKSSQPTKRALKKRASFGQSPSPSDFSLRRSKRNWTQLSHIQSLMSEDLQIAKAVSASLKDSSHVPEQLPLSLGNDISSDDGKKEKRKRGRPRKRDLAAADPPPLLLTTSPDAKRRLLMRVEEMLTHVERESGDEIPCTPAIKPSALGVPAVAKNRTCCEMVAEERNNEEGEKQERWDDAQLGVGEKDQSEVDIVRPPSASAGTSDPASLISRCCSLETTLTNLNYKTMWQLSAYSEDERMDEFYVEMLGERISPKKAKVSCIQCTTEELGHKDHRSNTQQQDQGNGGNAPQTVTTTTTTETETETVRGSHVGLVKDLQSMLSSGLFSDLSVLTADGRRVSAHSGILCSRCPNMMPILTATEDHVLDLSAFSSEAVSRFLHFLYTAELLLPLGKDIKEEMKTMAELWGIEELLHLISGREVQQPENRTGQTCFNPCLPDIEATDQHATEKNGKNSNESSEKAEKAAVEPCLVEPLLEQVHVASPDSTRTCSGDDPTQTKPHPGDLKGSGKISESNVKLSLDETSGERVGFPHHPATCKHPLPKASLVHTCTVSTGVQTMELVARDVETQTTPPICKDIKTQTAPLSCQSVEIQATPMQGQDIETQTIPTSWQDLGVQTIPLSCEDVESQTVSLSCQSTGIQTIPVTGKDVETQTVPLISRDVVKCTNSQDAETQTGHLMGVCFKEERVSPMSDDLNGDCTPPILVDQDDSSTVFPELPYHLQDPLDGSCVCLSPKTPPTSPPHSSPDTNHKVSGRNESSSLISSPRASPPPNLRETTPLPLLTDTIWSPPSSIFETPVSNTCNTNTSSPQQTPPTYKVVAPTTLDHSKRGGSPSSPSITSPATTNGKYSHTSSLDNIPPTDSLVQEELPEQATDLPMNRNHSPSPLVSPSWSEHPDSNFSEQLSTATSNVSSSSPISSYQPLFEETPPPSDQLSASTNANPNDEVLYYTDNHCCSPLDEGLLYDQEVEFADHSFLQSSTEDIRVIQATPSKNGQVEKTGEDASDSPMVVSDKHLVTPVLNRTNRNVVNAEVSVAMEVSIVSEDIDLYWKQLREHSMSEKIPQFTPKEQRKVEELVSDDNITPMPNYRTMATPCLKETCSSFGVRPMPKSKMIAKLEEIYEYTHPLVDKDGNVVNQMDKEKKKSPKKLKRKWKRGACSPESDGGKDPDQQLMESICNAIKQDEEMYQDIVLYKPLELTAIQQRLRVVNVSVSRERLAEVLDKLCITFTVPRSSRPGRTNH